MTGTVPFRHPLVEAPPLAGRRTTAANSPPAASPGLLPKAPTGVLGLDEITGGDPPLSRAALVCGPDAAIEVASERDHLAPLVGARLAGEKDR